MSKDATGGVTVTLPPLAVTGLLADKDDATVGDTITWTAAVSGGKTPYIYMFRVYRGTTQVHEQTYSQVNVCTYAPTEPGEYTARVYVRDGQAVVMEQAQSGVTTVALPLLSLESVEADKATAGVSESITWTATAVGGAAPYIYMFRVYRTTEAGKTQVYERAYASDNTCSYVPTIPGAYTALTFVRDTRYVEMAQEESGATDVSVPELVLTEVTADKTSATVGDTITWTATSTGGYDVIYLFILYRDGVQIAQTVYDSARTYSHTPTAPGVYTVKAYARSRAFGASVSKDATGGVTVTLPPLAVRDVAVSVPAAMVGRTITWTADAVGHGELSYEFAVLLEGEPVPDAVSQSDNTCSFTPVAVGTYEARATVTDEAGRTTSLTGGVVEIYDFLLAISSDVSATTFSLEGERTGVYGTFAPLHALPVGVIISHYHLDSVAGDAATLAYADHTGAENGCTLEYSLNHAGTATYTLTMFAYASGVELCTATLPLSITVQASAPNWPESFTYATPVVELDVGETFLFAYDDILDQDGVPLSRELPYTFRFPETGVTTVETQDGIQATFSEAGRYEVEITIEEENYWNNTYVTIIVGGETDFKRIPMRINYDMFGYFIDTLYPSGNTEGALGWISADTILLDNERAVWSVEKLDDNDAVSVEIYPDSPYGGVLAFSELKPVDTDQVVGFKVICFVNEFYYGEYSIWLTVAAEDLEGMPTGIEMGARVRNYAVDDIVTYSVEDVVGVGAPLPEGTEVSLEFDEQIWRYGNTDWDDDGGCTVTHRTAGRYAVTAVARYLSYEWRYVVEVTVGDGAHPYASISFDQSVSVLYGDADGYVDVASAELVGITEFEGDRGTWSLTPGDGEQAATLYMEVYNNTAQIWCDGETAREGTADYTLSYRLVNAAGDILFEQSVPVALTVQAQTDDLPDGIELLCDVPESIEFGDTIIIREDDIAFVGGTPPEGVYVNKYINYPYEVGRDDVEIWYRYEDDIQVRFYAPGRYRLEVVAQFVNLKYSTYIEVVVGDPTEGFRIESADDSKDTLYLEGQRSNYFGSFVAENAFVYPDDAWSWSLDLVGFTGDEQPVNLLISDSDERHCYLDYEDLNCAGTATYRLSYTALGGLYDGSTEFTITIVEGAPEGLPAGITYQPQTYHVAPGEVFTLRYDDISLVGGEGDFQMDWKDFWFDENAGDNAGLLEWTKSGIRLRYDQEGRYIVWAAVGVANFTLNCEILIIVGDGLNGELTIGKDVRSEELFLCDQTEGYFAFAWVDGVALLEDETASWTLRLKDGQSGNLPVKMRLTDKDVSYAVIDFYELADLGSVTYVLSYSAADGFYTAETEITATVVNPPQTLPTGVSFPDDTRLVQAGDTLTFDFADIALTGGEVPEGTKTWYDFWPSDNVWGACDVDRSDDGISVTFHEPGRYIVTAGAGISNWQFAIPIAIVVTNEEGDQPDLCLYQPIETVYRDGVQNNRIAWIYPFRFDWEGAEDRTWTLTRVDENPGTPVSLTLNDEGGCATVEYQIEDGEGPVTYRATLASDDGLFSASVLFTVTVVPNTPENMPSGISVPETLYQVDPGDTLVLPLADIHFAEGEVPAGMQVWRDYHERDGDWRSVDCRSTEECDVYTFYRPGRYWLLAEVGINNHIFECRVLIVVSGEPDFQLNQFQRVDTLYADARDYDYLGSVDADVALMEGEDWAWNIECIESEGNPVELTLADQDSRHTSIHYQLTGGTGTVTYRVSYTAADGYYAGYRDFTVTVLPSVPVDFPTGISVPATEYELDVGETLTLDFADIGFVEGSAPAGCEVWRELWWNEGDHQYCEEYGDEESRSFVFSKPGRFMIEAAVGIGNYFFTQRILITVRGEADFQLGQFQRFDTMYVGGWESHNLGAVDAWDVVLMEDDDWSWNIECIESEGNPVELTLTDQEPRHVSVNYQLTGETGTVTYRVSYAAADGYYAGYRDFTVTVLPSEPVDFPTGISIPHTEYEIDPNEKLVLNWADIHFAEGEVLEGCEVWRDLWWNEGRWEHADVEDNGQEYTLSFREPGRYVLEAVIGIGNYQFAQRILITVRGEADFQLGQFQRFDTMYVGGWESHNLGAVDAWDVVLMEDDDWSWNIECIESEGNPVELTLTDQEPRHVSVNYQLTGETGTVTYRVSYAAADGYYAGYRDFTVTVLPSEPVDFPTGISIPHTEYEIDPNEKLVLNWADINFSEGSVPEGCEVWRDLWWNEGRWEYADVDDNGQEYALSFREPGRYALEAVIGIGNYQFTQRILITVRGEAEYRLNQYMRFDALYRGATDTFNLGAVDAENVLLLEEEDWNWSVERIEGDDGLIEISLSDEGPYHVSINYSFTGEDFEEPISYTYRVTYAAADGYYAGYCDFAFTAYPGVPDTFPTGVRVPETEYRIAVGDTLTLSRADISFAEGEAPDGVAVWREYWMQEGDWGTCDAWEGEGYTNYTFSRPGRYVLNAMIGIGSYIMGQHINILVGGDVTCELVPHLRGDTLYADADLDGYFGYVSASDVTVLEDDDWSWSIERIDQNQGNPVELTIRDSWNRHADIDFHLTGETGTVTYRVTYAALGGYYSGSVDITATVAAEVPDGAPTDISFPTDSYLIQAGDRITFDKDEIALLGGEAPEGQTVWRDFYLSENVWNLCDVWNDDRYFEIMFREPGRYVVSAAAGVSNLRFIKPIVIIVQNEGGAAFELERSQRVETVYADSDARSGYLGNIRPKNFAWQGADECSWTVERVDENGGEPATIWLSDISDNANVNFNLLDGTGTVTYRATFTADGGLYTAYADFTLTVDPSVPDDFPTGISVSATEYEIDVNETLTLNRTDISFAEGSAPDGATVWRDYWRHAGDWSLCDSGIDGDAYRYSFRAPGRYVLKAAVGIGNYQFEREILIVVRGEPDFEMNSYMRFETLYADAVRDDYLGDVRVRGVSLLTDEDWSWSIERVDENGGDPLDLTIEHSAFDFASIHFHLKDGEGTATYRVSYTAAGGYYAGHVDLTVTVLNAAPSDYPTGAQLPETEYHISVGEALTFYRSDISFAVGETPADAAVWRDYWHHAGNFGACDMDDDGNRYTLVFREPGRYILRAAIGINNYRQTCDIVIEVGEAETLELIPSLRCDTLYADAAWDGYLGAIYAPDVVLMEGEEATWSIECVDGTPDASVALAIHDSWGDHANVNYRLSGGTGTVTYRVTYTAANGFYSGSADITVTVEAQTPADFPTGISVPQTIYYLDEENSIVLNLAAFGFSEGTVPEGAIVWKDFRTGDGNWSDWEQRRDGDVLTMTCNGGGYYTGYAAIGIGNYSYEQRIEFISGD